MNRKLILIVAVVVALQGCSKGFVHQDISTQMTVPSECQRRVPFFTKLPAPSEGEEVLPPEVFAQSWKVAKAKYRNLTSDYVVCREFIKGHFKLRSTKTL